MVRKIIDTIKVPNNLENDACKRIFLNTHGQFLSMKWPTSPVRSLRYSQIQKSKIRRNVNYQRWVLVEYEEEIMLVNSGKATDASELVSVEEVAVVEEEEVAICISCITPGTVLISEIIIGV